MNKNIWELYKNSEKGKNSISLFTINEDEKLEEKVTEIYAFYNNLTGDKRQIESAVNSFFYLRTIFLLTIYSPKKTKQIPSFLIF